MILTEEELKRYNRQLILPELGLEGQQKLKDAKVLVIGAGGLGCPVLQYLAAGGVGMLGVVDDDLVDLSNLHRQILFSAADLGGLKAEVAARKLRSLNPHVEVRPFTERLCAENAWEILKEYDVIMDGSDNFATRYLVNDICVELGKPLVSGSVFGFGGQVSVFNFRGGPDYRSVFPDAGESASCSQHGVLNVLPGMVGMYMANEALKVITGIGETLSGKLLVINALTAEANVFRLAPADELPPPVREEKSTQIVIPRDELAEWLAAHPTAYLVDVREPYEYEEDNPGGVNIPLAEIPYKMLSLPEDRDILFYCKSGKRSNIALKYVEKQNFPGRAAVLLLSE